MPLVPIEALAGLSDAALATWREALRRAKYDGAVLARAEAVAPNTFDPVRLPLVRWSLEKEGTPAALLALLFAYDGEAPEKPMRAALGESLVSSLTEAGVLGAGDRPGRLRAALRVLPLEDGWVLSDAPSAGGDAVMGPGATTVQLLAMLPARLEGAVLDLGCGAGTLALAAARRGASRVVGTDVNARAVAMAQINARLNEVQAEFRAGDLYAPVAGEKFAWLICQPPYVLQPPDTPGVTYLHGGPLGDAIALKAIAGAPQVLAPGGRALFLLDAPVHKGRPLHARVRDALGAAACDLVLLTAPGPSPDFQAVAYASLETSDFGPAYAAAALRYRAHLDMLGVTEFSHALVALREAGGRERPPFTASVPVPSLARLSGSGIEGVFAGLDLASGQDEALLAAQVRVPAQARWLEEREVPDPTAPPARSLRFPPGALSANRELTEAVWALLAALQEAPTVEQGVQTYAGLCDATPEEVRSQVLGFVRQGLGTGLLEARRRFP